MRSSPAPMPRPVRFLEALDTGKHTTTHARLYHLDAETHLIDSPGLQEFGLHHLDLHTLEAAFPEFGPISVAAASATATTTASPIARCAAHWLAAKSTRGDSPLPDAAHGSGVNR